MTAEQYEQMAEIADANDEFDKAAELYSIAAAEYLKRGDRAAWERCYHGQEANALACRP